LFHNVHGMFRTNQRTFISYVLISSMYFTWFLSSQMSGSRIKVAGRFKPCLHMGCFDLNTFVELNQRARKVSVCICENVLNRYICFGESMKNEVSCLEVFV
jgi:hypothetical protein